MPGVEVEMIRIYFSAWRTDGEQLDKWLKRKHLLLVGWRLRWNNQCGAGSRNTQPDWTVWGSHLVSLTDKPHGIYANWVWARAQWEISKRPPRLTFPPVGRANSRLCATEKTLWSPLSMWLMSWESICMWTIFTIKNSTITCFNQNRLLSSWTSCCQVTPT